MPNSAEAEQDGDHLIGVVTGAFRCARSDVIYAVRYVSSFAVAASQGPESVRPAPDPR